MPDEKIWKDFISSQTSPISFTDGFGDTRKFSLSGYIGIAYTIIATEIGKTPGYEFEASSFSSPHEAMILLVNKIRSSISTRYLDPNDHTSLLTDKCAGRIITHGVVIDGNFISWEKFMEIMSSHEGWYFEVKFSGG